MKSITLLKTASIFFVIILLASCGSVKNTEDNTAMYRSNAPAKKPQTSPSAIEDYPAPPPPKNIKTEELMETELDMVVSKNKVKEKKAGKDKMSKAGSPIPQAPVQTQNTHIANQIHNTENYHHIEENDFLLATEEPLSTFSIDVDGASYANSRRFLNQGQLPPADAIRIEEFVNYFDYDYPEPKGKDPFSINTEFGKCPWATDHYLMHVGLKGKSLDFSKAPQANLVFLLDVSGSMNSGNKLPLLKSALNLLTDEMRPEDRVAIVVYAGAAGLVLPSTPFSEKTKIMNAVNQLSAGGSTAGGAGIELAYKIAQENFVKGGNNRIILATDGDFNVGVSSDGSLIRMIEEKRKSGVFLTTLGFGMGNYKDSRMEQLANKGNGNYAYIDNILEAKKVLVNELSGTLFAIAKDVKLQVEFNPAKVHSYRLVGYENRMLETQDFNDDKKDAGELGAGHTVTALYEIIPVTGNSTNTTRATDLKYQTRSTTNLANNSNEWSSIKFRYKEPGADKSKLIEGTVVDSEVGIYSENFTFSAAVASWAMLMRGSDYKGKTSVEMILEMANQSKGKDENGYRAEFVALVKNSKPILEQLTAGN